MQSIPNSFVNRLPLQLVGFEPCVPVGPFKSERPIIDPRVGDSPVAAKILQLTLGESEVGTSFIEVHVRRFWHRFCFRGRGRLFRLRCGPLGEGLLKSASTVAASAGLADTLPGRWLPVHAGARFWESYTAMWGSGPSWRSKHGTWSGSAPTATSDLSLSHQRGSGSGSPPGQNQASYFAGLACGAGKSVIITDLLAQIGHRFGFRLIVEEGSKSSCRTSTR
jgi:hypothetical protein